MASRKSTKTTTKTSKPREKSAPKPTKPVFRVGTWITLLLLVLVIAAAILINRNAEATAEAEITPTVEAQFVFDPANPVTSIEVQPAEGETVRLERNTENAWVVTLPIELEADPALAEAAAAQVTALKINQEIDGDLSTFGLDEPAFIITLEFENGEKNTLEVGDATPINTGYYVRLDKEKMMIVTLSSIDALTTLAIFPPYLNTPTPSPLPPTETPV